MQKQYLFAVQHSPMQGPHKVTLAMTPKTAAMIELNKRGAHHKTETLHKHNKKSASVKVDKVQSKDQQSCSREQACGVQNAAMPKSN